MSCKRVFLKCCINNLACNKRMYGTFSSWKELVVPPVECNLVHCNLLAKLIAYATDAQHLNNLLLEIVGFCRGNKR